MLQLRVGQVTEKKQRQEHEAALKAALQEAAQAKAAAAAAEASAAGAREAARRHAEEKKQLRGELNDLNEVVVHLMTCHC